MKGPKKLKLYLDTTIPSYVYALDSPDRMEITRRFMKLRLLRDYEMLISEVIKAWQLQTNLLQKQNPGVRQMMFHRKTESDLIFIKFFQALKRLVL